MLSLGTIGEMALGSLSAGAPMEYVQSDTDSTESDTKVYEVGLFFYSDGMKFTTGYKHINEALKKRPEGLVEIDSDNDGNPDFKLHPSYVIAGVAKKGDGDSEENRQLAKRLNTLRIEYDIDDDGQPDFESFCNYIEKSNDQVHNVKINGEYKGVEYNGKVFVSYGPNVFYTNALGPNGDPSQVKNTVFSPVSVGYKRFQISDPENGIVGIRLEDFIRIALDDHCKKIRSSFFHNREEQIPGAGKMRKNSTYQRTFELFEEGVFNKSPIPESVKRDVLDYKNGEHERTKYKSNFPHTTTMSSPYMPPLDVPTEEPQKQRRPRLDINRRGN